MIHINTMTTYPAVRQPVHLEGHSWQIETTNALPEDIVSISQGARIYMHDDTIMQPMEPKQPLLPNQGEKLEQIIAAKKSIAMYQAVSQNGGGKLSLTQAYILKNNEDVRQAYVAKEQKAHNQSLIAAYQSGQETALNEYA